MLSKLGTLTERERRINPESLYISLCLCLSVSSGFVCTVTNRNSLKKRRKKQSRDKDQNGPTLKTHDEEDENFFSYFPRSIERLIYTTLVSIIIGIIADFFFTNEAKIRGIFRRDKENFDELKKMRICIGLYIYVLMCGFPDTGDR